MRGEKYLRVRQQSYPLENTFTGLIGYQTNKDAKRERDDAKRDRNNPTAAANASDLESGASGYEYQHVYHNHFSKKSAMPRGRERM